MVLRKSLKCKSFEWYLSNIWTEHFFPANDRFFGKLLLLDPNTELFDEYLNMMSEYNFANNFNWTYAISYFNEHASQLQKLFAKHSTAFCLQKPQNQGVLSLPYGQAGLKRCNDKTTVIDELFVVTPDGHVSYLIYTLIYITNLHRCIFCI